MQASKRTQCRLCRWSDCMLNCTAWRSSPSQGLDRSTTTATDLLILLLIAFNNLDKKYNQTEILCTVHANGNVYLYM